MDVQVETGGQANRYNVFPSISLPWEGHLGRESSTPASKGEQVQTAGAKRGKQLPRYPLPHPKTTRSGRLVVHGLQLPEQDFVEYVVNGRKIIENQPAAPFPRVRFEINGQGQRQRFDSSIRPYDDSVDALLLQTRVSFCIARTGHFSLDVGERLGLRPHPTAAEVENQLYLAKLVRKLKHLERLFGVQLALPEVYPSRLLRDIEILYRGTTEGEFSIRAASITATGLLPSEMDISQPPFASCGKFSGEKREGIQLLGQTWATGPITVTAERALVADSSVMQKMIEAPEMPLDVDFAVFDNQVSYRFEDFVGRRNRESAETLSRLKAELSTQEPDELVNLMDDSLQAEVSEFEASHVAMGWLWSHDFPDRYCPQDPQLDREHSCWRVPISLVYTSGSGRFVGEIVIDLKSAAVKALPSIEEMRARGAALATELANAQ
jgi:hypothetical protein